jgi:hypothetical protein
MSRTKKLISSNKSRLETKSVSVVVGCRPDFYTKTMKLKLIGKSDVPFTYCTYFYIVIYYILLNMFFDYD